MRANRDAALWGTDVGKGMLWGAASGAVLTTLTSENWKNWRKGKGFKNNSSVFEDFRAGNYTSNSNSWQQDALDYFEFEGKYKSSKGSGAEYVEGKSFFGSTSLTTGDISYGDNAFSSYANLRATYQKEYFHHIRVQKGIPFESFNRKGLEHLKYYMEEAKGFQSAFKNNGLYPKSSIAFMNQTSAYWIPIYGSGLMKESAWYYFIYKIPRRW